MHARPKLSVFLSPQKDLCLRNIRRLSNVTPEPLVYSPTRAAVGTGQKSRSVPKASSLGDIVIQNVGKWSRPRMGSGSNSARPKILPDRPPPRDYTPDLSAVGENQFRSDSFAARMAKTRRTQIEMNPPLAKLQASPALSDDDSRRQDARPSFPGGREVGRQRGDDRPQLKRAPSSERNVEGGGSDRRRTDDRRPAPKLDRQGDRRQGNSEQRGRASLGAKPDGERRRTMQKNGSSAGNSFAASMTAERDQRSPSDVQEMAVTLEHGAPTPPRIDLERTDFAALFGPSTKEVVAPSSPVRLRSTDSTRSQASLSARLVMERVGGDYSRYLPEQLNVSLQTTDARHAVSYAGLALARRRDVGLRQRRIALTIVQKAVKEARKQTALEVAPP